MAAPDDQRCVGAPVPQNQYIRISRPIVTILNTASCRILPISAPVRQAPRPPVPTPVWPPLPTTVPSKPLERSHTIRHSGRIASDYVPARYTWDTGPSNVPGAAAYYRSRTFYKKKEAGTVQRSRCSANSIGDDDDDDDEAYKSMSEDTSGSAKPRSLVMILSRTNVRRASVKGKAQLRMQRQNKRMYVA